jgi:hypothetical protein
MQESSDEVLDRIFACDRKDKCQAIFGRCIIRSLPVVAIPALVLGVAWSWIPIVGIVLMYVTFLLYVKKILGENPPRQNFLKTLLFRLLIKGALPTNR